MAAGRLAATERRSSGLLWEKTFDGRGGETNAVPEARVDVFIRKNGVSLLRKSGDAGEAGKVTGGVDMAGLLAEERGEFFLKLDMVGARAVGHAGAGGAGAPFEESGAGSLDDLGMKGEPEVIVAREHDHVAALETDGGALLRLHRVVVGRVAQTELGGRIIAAAAANTGGFG